MVYDPDVHHRRSIRIRGFDYSKANMYYITICVEKHFCLLGKIIDAKMVLNEYGNIVVECWNDLTNHYYNIELSEYVVMPNHFHGIIKIVGAGFKPARDTQNNRRADFKPAPTLSELVRALKTFSARRINKLRQKPDVAFWQRNYFEHIVRDECDLGRIREYIVTNPARWENDELYRKE